MISIENVLRIHALAAEKFGGAAIMGDKSKLESALAIAFQTIDGKEKYSTIIEKAAALAESIIISHPFIDGNKRTGYILLESLLRYEGLYITASDNDLYNFIISISTRNIRSVEIIAWLRLNTESKENSL